MKNLKEVLTCTKCELSCSRNRIVLFRGNPQAKIMIVGDAPGTEEDAAGLPFVGRQGQLLDNMFASIGIDTNKDCYITKLVKCMPPRTEDGVRSPTKQELDSCQPYFWTQMYNLDPKVVICVGATAAHALIGVSLPISTCRGVWHVMGDRHFIAIHSPEYLLQFPGYTKYSPRYYAAADMRSIKDRCEKLEILPPTAIKKDVLSAKM